MRYTTLIDISQAPQLYRNINVRLVYLHLVLKAGYHTQDRDIVPTSVRRLAADVGITESAVRHAIKQLTAYGLLVARDRHYIVRKWCEQGEYADRPKTKREQRKMELEIERQRQNMAREAASEALNRQREEYQRQGTNSYEVYINTLKERAAKGDQEAQELLRRKKIVT